MKFSLGSISAVLLVVFLVCKLAGWGAIATWSWVWVLAPLWISAIIIGVFIVLFLTAAVHKAVSKK